MPRIRSIKPSAFSSETLSRLPRALRWTFAGLWTYCDDEGRGNANPRLIKAELYPLDDDVTPTVIDAELDELVTLGVVCRYEAAGKSWFHVVSFAEHQHPSKPQVSKFPPCPKDTHDPFPERSGNGQGTVAAVVGVGVGGDKEEEEDKEDKTAAEPQREDVEQLCSHLADRIEATGSKRPRITQRWRREARLLLDNDRRALDEAMRLVSWSLASSFWQPFIQSMPKFREKYDTLRLQALNANRGSPGRQVYRNPSDQSVYDEPLEAS